MKGTIYKTKADVLRRGQEAVGIPLGQIDKTGRLKTGKGAIGTMLEESWFGYSPNSETEPDFPEAGVELKATPYLRTKSSIRAKERLVCNIINYMTEYKKTFETSDFWHKCNTILIMSYEHKYDLPKSSFTIDKAVLFSFPMTDLRIIEQDWKKIIQKIKNGEAHLLTEGDTLYLAACTKGATSKTVRPQPFSDIPAKQRAYSLKSSYMTHILRTYVFGNNIDKRIIKDWRELNNLTFEEVITNKISKYYGKSQSELKSMFHIKSTAKNINELILAKILGIKGKISKAEEFKNASIIPKTVRITAKGKIKEHVPLNTFKFGDIINETWKTSRLRSELEPTKFLFVIFQESEDGYILQQVKFWNIPLADLEEVHKVWKRTVHIIKSGVQITYDGHKFHNNLPKSSENPVAHVRPHGKKGDTYPLPDGRKMAKQSFWLNKSYIKHIIDNDN